MTIEKLKNIKYHQPLKAKRNKRKCACQTKPCYDNLLHRRRFRMFEKYACDGKLCTSKYGGPLIHDLVS